ncbi:MAG: hypothetical protein WC340_06765 [Kiritimatiellia bacterium]
MVEKREVSIQKRFSDAHALLEALVPKGEPAWLLYLDELERAAKWKALAASSRQVLEFPLGKQRAYVAELLQRAGTELNDMDDVADGGRSRFMESPSLATLSSFIQLIPDHNRLRAELLKCDAQLSDQPFSGTHAAIKLLLGELDEVFVKCEPFKSVGWSWSSESHAIAVCGGFIALCDHKEKLPTSVANFLTRYLAPRDWRSCEDPTVALDASCQALLSALRAALSGLNLNSDEKLVWLMRLQKIIAARANTIVSNKYRKAYGRAAEGLIAWRDVAKLSISEDVADRFILAIRNRYNRFTAFRRELDTRS